MSPPEWAGSVLSFAWRIDPAPLSAENLPCQTLVYRCTNCPLPPKCSFLLINTMLVFFTVAPQSPCPCGFPGVLFLPCQAWPSAFATWPPPPASPSLSSSLFFESFLALHQLLPLPSSLHNAGLGETGRRIEHQRKSAVGVWGLWFGIGLSGK